MVRHKSRWLLVNIMSPHDEKLPSTIEKKHIFHAIRTMIDTAFGVAGSIMTEDIQGKQFYE